ncbi:GSCFA domain-containing protein (plasmid) [Sinorhizobium chiapasense]|uniref:GSCFA domain-containing protein n=1 Tax=Sinorhizobium chiapasense TaxID=501572 RepID=UPI002FE195B4
MGNALEVLKEAARNGASRWSYGDVNRDREPDLAINRIGHEYFVPKFEPKFQITSGSAFFTLGSCFARELETALLRLGWAVPSRLRHIEGHSLFAPRKGVTTIHDYFNRYNIPSICAEIQNISNLNCCQLGDELIYESASGLYDDLHYTPAAESCSLELLRDRRSWLWRELSQGYLRADVVVLTLGLCEAWYDSSCGRYLNVVSSPQMLRRYSEELAVRFIGFTEALGYLTPALDKLQSDGKKVIMTVSPVPLQNTFLGQDVVIANSAAKSNLRALCVEAASKYENVDYFPSFEMVTYSEKSFAWKADGRHVQFGMVEKIMKFALDSYIAS